MHREKKWKMIFDFFFYEKSLEETVYLLSQRMYFTFNYLENKK